MPRRKKSQPIPLALTDHQLKLVVHVANGMRARDIAGTEFMSESSVMKTLNAARKNMGAITLPHLVALTIAHGLLEWNQDDGAHRANGKSK
jgi:DNA-binding CsgD family transcriptional regulator